jgi:MFS transporter, SP family, sugar:H+ symporter
VFFIWGGFCVICCFFVWFCIYETKGLSLEQVDELYAKVPNARQSRGFVPTVNFTDVQEYAGAGDARRSTLAELEQGAVRRKSSAGVHTDYVKAD